MNRARRWSSSGFMVFLGLSAMPPALSQPAPPVTPTVRTIAPITNEIPGQATRTWFQYLSQPEVAARSWAAVVVRVNENGFDSSVCSGTMIGPNMMLTASHCHAEAISGVQFIAYASATEKITENYPCRTLLFGWPETDVDLVWCGAKGGVNPGDRWGYLDLDVDVDNKLHLVTDQPRYKPVVGLPIYSNWWNPVDALSTDAMLYSQGTIGEMGTGGWFNMGGSPCSNDDDDPDGVSASIFGIPGSSGSGMLTSATHRLILGPNSTAPGGEGGNFRGTASIINLLTKAKLSRDTSGKCAERGGEPVDAAALQILWDTGIKFDPDRNNTGKYYDAILDADGNGMFDVQEDLEKSAGETQRSFYNLGFDSLRRAVQWKRNETARFSVRPFWGSVNVDAHPGDWQQAVIASPQLHMAYPATHWVHYHVQATRPARIRMRVGGGQYIENVTAGTDRTVVQQVQGVSIAIDVAGEGTMRFRDFSVWNPAKPFTFDMFDERKVWKRKAADRDPPSAEAAAIFMPHVRQGVAGPNWAGLIRARQAQVISTGNSSGIAAGLAIDDRLYSEALATPTTGPGRFRVCFDHRLFGTGPLTQPGAGRLTITGGSGADLEFTASGAWQTSCTTTRRGGLKAMEFRALPPPVGTAVILIDNVSVSWTPLPVVTHVPVGPSVP